MLDNIEIWKHVSIDPQIIRLQKRIDYLNILVDEYHEAVFLLWKAIQESDPSIMPEELDDIFKNQRYPGN